MKLSRSKVILISLLVAIIILSITGFAVFKIGSCLNLFFRFPTTTERSLSSFSQSSQPSILNYEDLFSYFVDGFLSYRTADGAHARYPGWPMGGGDPEDRHQDELEGFSRVAPLLAAWLHSGRESHIRLPSGRAVDIVGLLRTGILNGTAPRSIGYWGSIGDRDSKIVEAHDIALSIWLSREQLWNTLSDSEKSQISTWLSGVSRRETVDNNWHLFIVVVNLILHDLGMPYDETEAWRRYTRFKSFYLGDGWFRDGPNGHIDYYNAWGIHYSLFWINKIDPKFDYAFLNDVLSKFSASFKYFFGPYGFPIMGRSICYRIAASAPLVMAYISKSPSITTGEARRALDLTWQRFIKMGAVREGGISQGYFKDDARWLDGYSGPASCLWSLRSLVVAFSLPRESSFWQSSGEQLPVEKSDFSIDLETIGRRLIGSHKDQDVRLVAIEPGHPRMVPIKDYTYFRRITDALLCRSRRPENTSAKYDLATYSSRYPFCTSSALR